MFTPLATLLLWETVSQGNFASGIGFGKSVNTTIAKNHVIWQP